MLGHVCISGVVNSKGLSTTKGFTAQSEFVADQDFKITGITLDSNGAVLGSCKVNLFDTVTNTLIATTVSDPTTGIYIFFANPITTNYAVSYKAGAPDVAGTTVNTLTGV